MRNQYLVKMACHRVAALTDQYLELGLPLNSALRAAEADLREPENLSAFIGVNSTVATVDLGAAIDLPAVLKQHGNQVIESLTRLWNEILKLFEQILRH